MASTAQELRGDGLTQRGRYPGVQGQRPNKGSRSSGRTPQVDTYFGNGCKTDILRQKKIENAYMSRCFPIRTHAAVLSIHDNRHT